MILNTSKIQNRNAQYKTFRQLKDRRVNSTTHSTSTCDSFARLSAAIVNNAFIQYSHLVNKKKSKPKTAKGIKKRKDAIKDIELFFEEFNAPSIAYLESIGHEMNKDLCLQKLKEIKGYYGRKRRKRT
jgi:hypothetical protein